MCVMAIVHETSLAERTGSAVRPDSETNERGERVEGVDPPIVDGEGQDDDDRPDVQVHFTKAPDLDLIYELMVRHGYSTAQDVVRGALSFYAWVSEQEEQGSRFQIARPGGVDTYELNRPLSKSTQRPSRRHRQGRSIRSARA
jgi:hypothetical protein